MNIKIYINIYVYIFANLSKRLWECSIIFSGMIDFLISNHPIAKVLREHIVFKIVPMLNPDGVYLGNYRWNYYFDQILIFMPHH